MDGQRDWQTNCPEIKTRGQVILQTEQWSDCRFLAGPEGGEQQFFSGHKLILAMASPVFERMFYGSLAEKSDIILVSDVTPYAFSSMLSYIYTDKILIETFENACEIYYAAKKYILPHALLKCISYLLQNLNPGNVCRAYEFAKLFDEPSLESKCTQMFSNRTKEILSHPNFMEIRLSTLREVFSIDKLMIPEIDLFRALNDYAIVNGYISQLKENENNGVQNKLLLNKKQEIYMPDDEEEKNQPNKRNIDDLKYAMRKIRFLSLSPQQFAEIASRSCLLTESEALAILINIVSPNFNMYPMPEGFSTSRNRRS